MSDPIIRVAALGSHWQTQDPFLFCVHHIDHFPRGNDRLGPAASLAGRDLGRDFSGLDGWRMYHGDVVPGFPQHPHRGFETVTIVREGYIDHSDSLGATARFGMGDVQWLTAGAGVVHSEMFPLLNQDAPNTLELFQIWLNLPSSSKMAEPYFTMFWDQEMPRLRPGGADGTSGSPALAGSRAPSGVEVTLIAGALDGLQPLAPPPHSWAAREDADVAIWSIAMEAGAAWVLPPGGHAGTLRTLHLFAGSGIRIGGRLVPGPAAIQVHAGRPLTVEAANGPADILLLQGRPIGEPVAAHGPFVMNTRAELEQAFADFRRTQFGGWPWPVDAPVHAREQARFARHADGRIDRAPG